MQGFGKPHYTNVQMPWPNLPPDVLMEPTSIANAYWALHQQSRDAWTFEMDLRPFGETW
jgi:hypothetical protein